MRFGFILVVAALIQGSLQYPEEDIPPKEVINIMAERKTRLHHNLFHIIRMNYPLLDAIEQKQIADLGWTPTYFSFSFPTGDVNDPVTLYNPNGEDFLYMHRKMIARVNNEAEKANSSWRVKGWEKCPHPDDSDWPVPEIPQQVMDENFWAEEYYGGFKSREFYEDVITPAEDFISKRENLEGLSIGDLGVILEYELHTYFHVRFSGYNPVGYRMQGLHPTERIAEKWDNPEYDFLADFYSAHVNVHFWKIHGWIEDRITDWAGANNITNASSWIWNTDPWTTGPMDERVLAALEQVGADAVVRANAQPEEEEKNKHDAGVIVGSVIGGLVLGFIIALIGFLCMSKVLANKYQSQASAAQSKAGQV